MGHIWGCILSVSEHFRQLLTDCFHFSRTTAILQNYKIACAQQKLACVPEQSDHSLSWLHAETMVISRPARGEDSWDCIGVNAELSLRSAGSRFFMRRLILYLNCRVRQISQNTRKGRNNHKTYTNMSESFFHCSTNKHSATAQKSSWPHFKAF